MAASAWFAKFRQKQLDRAGGLCQRGDACVEKVRIGRVGAAARVLVLPNVDGDRRRLVVCLGCYACKAGRLFPASARSGS